MKNLKSYTVKMLKLLVFKHLLLFVLPAKAQETWSLDKCHNYAYAHNTIIKQGDLQAKGAKQGEKEANFSRYPTLSANSNVGFNAGRAVNPSTNNFELSNAAFNNFALTAHILLYNGGRLQEEVKRAKTEVSIAHIGIEQAYQSLSLQIIHAYFQVLLHEEQSDIAKKQWVQSQNQLAKMDDLIRVGSASTAMRSDIEAQMARAEQQMAIAANNVELGLSNLKNLLQMPLEMSLKLEKPKAAISAINPLETYDVQALYKAALANQAQIKMGDLQVKSAEIGVKIAKSSLLPSLSLQGNLGSNYSNLIMDESKATILGTQERTESVKIDGRAAQFTSSNPILSMPIKSYETQVRNNFNQSVILALQLPILDGFSKKIGIERAKIEVEQRHLELEQSRIQLRTDVQNAWSSAKAAHKIYWATKKLYDAQKVVYEAANNRFQVGNTPLFERTQAKNQLDISERDSVIAKYDYLFKMEILAYYEGKRH